MANAKGTFSSPILEGVTLTLSVHEAELLTRFLGKTQLGLVQDLMPYETDSYQKDVNNVLYETYEALNNVMELSY
jgi:hypothetical protein